MASIVLTLGGSALGNAIVPGIGGAILGGIGASIGHSLDNAIFGSSKITGPRLDTLKIQDSTYGKPMPVVYGNARVAGNVIWSSDLIETLSTSEVGGKGGGGSATSVQKASYAVDCAVAIGMPPLGSSMGGIRTIWADSKIIYSDGQWSPNIIAEAELYLGSMTQTPSPLMESYLGAGNVPAYRGLAYIVLHRLQLANFGNRLPNITFECMPADGAVTPLFLGEYNPSLLTRPQTAASYGALPAIPIARSGAGASRMLVGGVVQTGSQFQFAAVEVDVSGDVPVEIHRSLSSAITHTDLSDVSWAISPDGQSVACYMQHIESGNPATFWLYHIATRSFGAPCVDHLGASSSLNQLAWLDGQRFVLWDSVSGQSGVRVYLQAGTGIVPLGFFGIWGAGSSSARQALPFAQFCNLSGGLGVLACDAFFTPSNIYARTITWRGDGLQIGSEVVLGTGLSGFSSISAAILPLGAGEFVLARMGINGIQLVSFTANFIAVVVTRAWQMISITPSGDISVSLRDGRIVFMHEPYSTDSYYYGEIAIDAASFSLVMPGTLVTGNYYGVLNNFSLYAIGGARYVLQAAASNGSLERLAIIERNVAGGTLGAVVADILKRAGYADADVDVSALGNISLQGYVVDNTTSARAAMEPLQTYQPFDLTESDGVLRARLYTATPSTTIAATEARAVIGTKEQPPALQTTRMQELDMPLSVSVDYLDPTLAFQRSTQSARRIATSARANENIKLPVVCDANTAKSVAQNQLYRRWVERSEHELSLNRSCMAVDVGDVISFLGQNLRITQLDQSGGLIKALAVPVADQLANIAAVAEGGTPAPAHVIDTTPTTLYLLDIPLLRAEDDQPGFYVAVGGGPAWRGASLFRSSDDVNFSAQDNFSYPVTAGIATNALAARSSYYMDRVSSVTIALQSGSLSSCTADELLNGANAALLGNEIIQFQTATLNADGTVTLSNLLRGRKGSEAAIATHGIGERFILLQTATVHFLPLSLSDRGRVFYMRGVSVGEDVHDVADTVFTPGFTHLKPLPPQHLAATRNSAGDISLSWKRRARSDAEWQNDIDVPLDEASEQYDVEVTSGSTVVRTFSAVTAPNVTYSAAQQTTDFGAPQSTVTFTIYQLSSRMGRGAPAQAIL